jgi:hypothetical protein
MGPLALCALLMLAYLAAVFQAKLQAKLAAKKLDAKKRCYAVPPAMEDLFDAKEVDRFKTVFARIDEDGNGTISAGELAKVLRRFDPDALDEELAAKVKAILGDVDVDLNDDIGKHGQRRRQR